MIARSIVVFLFSHRLMTSNRLMLVTLASLHLSAHLWVLQTMASCKLPGGCYRSTGFALLEGITSFPILTLLKIVQPTLRVYLNDSVVALALLGVFLNSVAAGALAFMAARFLSRRALCSINKSYLSIACTVLTLCIWALVITLLSIHLRNLSISIAAAFFVALVIHVFVRSFEGLIASWNS